MGLSVATPGVTGAGRLAALQARLLEAQRKQSKEAAALRKPTSTTRIAAFKAFRKDQVTVVGHEF